MAISADINVKGPIRGFSLIYMTCYSARAVKLCTVLYNLHATLATLPATGKGDIPALTPAEAGTRLSDPGGCKAELT